MNHGGYSGQTDVAEARQLNCACGSSETPTESCATVPMTLGAWGSSYTRPNLPGNAAIGAPGTRVAMNGAGNVPIFRDSTPRRAGEVIE
jgi:hypothetical protein